MSRGINRAEYIKKGYSLESISNTPGKNCIFLSHTSVDKPYVREIRENIKAIGDYIREGGIDIYLDENDEMLQNAVNEKNPNEVTRLIEQAICNSTHLMCIVSNHTQNSWWVPYEVGYAKKSFPPQKQRLATLKLTRDSYLPDYLAITQELKGAEDLYAYLESIKGDSSYCFDSTSYAMESYQINKDNHPLKSYLDWNT